MACKQSICFCLQIKEAGSDDHLQGKLSSHCLVGLTAQRFALFHPWTLFDGVLVVSVQDVSPTASARVEDDNHPRRRVSQVEIQQVHNELYPKFLVSSSCAAATNQYTYKLTPTTAQYLHNLS